MRLPVLACVVVVAVGAAASGCFTYHFTPDALVEAIELRDAEARLLAPVARSSPASKARGLVIASHKGRRVTVPPHAELRLETDAGRVTVEPRTLRLGPGDVLEADGHRVDLGALREGVWRRPPTTPLVLGIFGSIAVVLGLSALVIYIQEY